MRTHWVKTAHTNIVRPGRVLGWVAAAAMLTATARGGFPELPVNLGTAGDFVILAETGISTVPYSNITGDMGVSPVTATAITGFSLIMDGSTQFSTSAQVTGKIYASTYGLPTPSKMTVAIGDMHTAYTQAAGRTGPNTTGFMGGDISGQTITPGLHKWSTGVLINTDVWLDAQGDPNAVFIFQIAGNLTMAGSQNVILAGGAQAKNIFWQVGGGAGAVIGTYAHFEGIILSATKIDVLTGASFNGKLLAQTAVNLDQNNIMDADLIAPPMVQLDIISVHGTGTPATGTYFNAYGSLLTNSITAVETIGGTQYVNVGWTMVGNAPLAGIATNMVMVQTNNAVLTWQWSTNYYLGLSATNGSITNAVPGWKPAGSSYSPYPVPDPTYAFEGWDVNGAPQGTNVPLTVVMDQARNVVARFASLFVDVSQVVVWNVDWVFDPRQGIYIGTLTITNPVGSLKTLLAPIWFEVQSTEWHWLRFPTGFDGQTGRHYLDLTAAVMHQLDDQTFDPGDSVTVTGIELMGRRTTDGVLMAVWADPPAGGAVLPAPARPILNWAAVPGAAWYHVWLSRNGGTYETFWLNGVTTWQPPTDLPAGTYDWWVQPWGPGIGEGSWVGPNSFVVPAILPGALALTAPSGPQTEVNLTYRWQKDAVATWYHLWVGNTDGTTFHDQWYALTDVGEAAVLLSNHPTGDYAWWLQPWAPDGLGTWSGPMSFSIATAAPDKPVATAPVGPIVVARPTFQWNVAARAQWYHVYVVRGATPVLDQWTQATTVPTSGDLSSGVHSWWVGAWNDVTQTVVWSDRMDFSAP